MQGGYFSYALLVALATALLVAAFTDIKRREIDNWLNAAIALAAPLWWLAMGYGWLDIASQVGLAVATLVITVLLFAVRQMGGGDVKLLAALALWFTPSSFVQLIVMMALIGGGASVALAFINMQRVPGELARDALAGTVTLAWVLFTGAIAYGLMAQRPLLAPETTASIGAALPQPWILALAAILLLAICAVGFRHIFRRQKSSLPVPYGVAISLAGLWVLSEMAIPTVL